MAPVRMENQPTPCQRVVLTPSPLSRRAVPNRSGHIMFAAGFQSDYNSRSKITSENCHSFCPDNNLCGFVGRAMATSFTRSVVLSVQGDFEVAHV